MYLGSLIRVFAIIVYLFINLVIWCEYVCVYLCVCGGGGEGRREGEGYRLQICSSLIMKQTTKVFYHGNLVTRLFLII